MIQQTYWEPCIKEFFDQEWQNQGKKKEFTPIVPGSKKKNNIMTWDELVASLGIKKEKQRDKNKNNKHNKIIKTNS